MFKMLGTCAPIGSRRCTKREASRRGLGGERSPIDQAMAITDYRIRGK